MRAHPSPAMKGEMAGFRPMTSPHKPFSGIIKKIRVTVADIRRPYVGSPTFRKASQGLNLGGLVVLLAGLPQAEWAARRCNAYAGPPCNLMRLPQAVAIGSGVEV